MNKRQAKKARKKQASGVFGSPGQKYRYIRKSLLKRSVSEKGNQVYKIPASQVRLNEFKKLVKQANDRLRRLEKAGLYEESREYRLVSHYAYSDPNGKGRIYNVNPEKDTIRFSSKLPEKGLQYGADIEYQINALRNFLNAKTSTVSGTKEVTKKAYETFMRENGQRSNMSQEEYMNMWKIYHDMGLRDKLDNQGYNTFMTLMTQTDLYKLSNEEIETALRYIETSEKISTSGKIYDVMENLSIEDNITLGWGG